MKKNAFLTKGYICVVIKRRQEADRAACRQTGQEESADQ